MEQREGTGRRLDRRRSDRFILHQVVEIGFGRESFVRSIGVDVSRTGIRCRTDQELEPASIAFLMFSFPTRDGRQHTVRVEAVVMRCVAVENALFDVGMQFTELTDADRVALAEFCETGPEPA